MAQGEAFKKLQIRAAFTSRLSSEMPTADKPIRSLAKKSETPVVSRPEPKSTVSDLYVCGEFALRAELPLAGASGITHG